MTDVEGPRGDRPGTTNCASPAEVARSLVVASSTVSVHVAGDPAVVLVNMHRTDTGGRLLLAVPGDTTLVARTAAGAVAAQGLLVDVAPVAVRERERARLELSGRLHLLPREGAATAWAGSHPAGGRLGRGEVLLRLDPRVLVLHRSGLGAADVGIEEYSRARCDPLARHEAEILQHLVSAHPEPCACSPGWCPPTSCARPTAWCRSAWTATGWCCAWSPRRATSTPSCRCPTACRPAGSDRGRRPVPGARPAVLCLHRSCQRPAPEGVTHRGAGAPRWWSRAGRRVTGAVRHDVAPAATTLLRQHHDTPTAVGLTQRCAARM